MIASRYAGTSRTIHVVPAMIKQDRPRVAGPTQRAAERQADRDPRHRESENEQQLPADVHDFVRVLPADEQVGDLSAEDIMTSAERDHEHQRIARRQPTSPARPGPGRFAPRLWPTSAVVATLKPNPTLKVRLWIASVTPCAASAVVPRLAMIRV